MTKTIGHSAAECLRCRLRSRAVKRAYFTLTFTAMHAHPVRRRTAPVSYVRRHAPYGALYGYCIKIFQFLFLSNFTAPNAMFMPRRVNKLPHNYQSGAQRATTRIGTGSLPARIGTGSLPARIDCGGTPPPAEL